jgi:uncharacterized protein (TIGR02271 family)
MTPTDRTLVAGVFQKETQAQQAMSNLQNAGFSDDQIRYSVHKGGSGILDSLMKLGFAPDEANYYNAEFLAGRTVVTVKSTYRQQEAYDILRRNGAYDASSRIGQTTRAAADDAAEGAHKLQLKEEQLSATKQQVQTGEVGLHKEVVTEEKTIAVPVNREELVIERHPVSGTVPSDTPITMQEETIRIPLREEQVQVTKEPVVREEINIGKRVVQETQQVRGTVQREEARIEQTGDVNVQDAAVDNGSARFDQ